MAILDRHLLPPAPSRPTRALTGRANIDTGRLAPATRRAQPRPHGTRGGCTMAVESSASATWNGDLMGGRGSVRPASGAFAELPLTWRQRAESRESGTSPEELIAAAHAGCFAMALSHGLAGGGHPPESLETGARVGFQAGEGITRIHLPVRRRLPGPGPD